MIQIKNTLLTTTLTRVTAMTAVIASMAVSTGCHCVSSACHAIPANRLDPSLFACPREGLAPLPYSVLGQPKPSEHLIGPGDTLSVYVFGVFPPGEDETPVQQRVQAVNQIYYPPEGAVLGSATGLPVRVNADGTVTLPLVDPIDLNGKTVTQAIETIRNVYKDEKVLKQGREQVSVSLFIPRVSRVVVLREDSPATNVSLVQPTTNDEIHRGSGQVIDLPVYENDVLHALASTGGLPGTDAARELYVIRQTSGLNQQYLDVKSLQKIVNGGAGPGCNGGVVRLPLVGCPCEAIPFTQEDVVLNSGDVLFVPRRNEYFITGGMIPGSRIALPRDEDIDVIEAIAMATGSAGGPLGQSGSVLAGGNPGYVSEPTRVMVLRKLPDGRQLTIRVDIGRAMRDPKERIRIQPDDVVMLYFKPASAGWNVFLNYISGSSIVQTLGRAGID